MDKLTKLDLLRRTGSMEQVCGARDVTVNDGRGKGVGLYEVKTGGGFAFTLMKDKCLDILDATYKGINLGYLCKNGLVAPEYFYPVEDGFGANMTGGLMFTVGLRNGGGGCRDNGAWHVTHGRAAMTPTEAPYAKCAWDGDDYTIEIGGDIRESTLFGHNLRMRRTYKTAYGQNGFELCDVIENLTPNPEEFMTLYHTNLGWPLLSEDVRVIVDSKLTPIGDRAAEMIGDYNSMPAPVDNGGEVCYFHDVTPDNEGWCVVRVENPVLGIGMRISYMKQTLPILVQWKAMSSGDYALGIEPSNSYIKGRVAERENGTLPSIPAYGSVVNRLRMSAYDL